MPGKGVGTLRSGLRSDFIIHWTGAKDIDEEYKHHGDNDKRIDAYVDRLRGTLAEGLWINTVDEPLTTVLPAGFRKDMICFTEIKLSSVAEHAKDYGHLGFGFSRKFITERGGAPVIYVSGLNDDITQQFIRQFLILLALIKTPDVVDFVNQSGYISKMLLILQSLGAVKYLRPDFRQHVLDRLAMCARGKRNVFEDLMNSIANNLLFVKYMSDNELKPDYKYLNESEWRILYTPLTHGCCFDSERDSWKYKKGDMPVVKIPFKQGQLKVLILPDDDVRKKALSEPYIKQWLSSDPPIIATVKDCMNL